MAKSKPKQDKTPRRKRFNRRQRLDSAKHWLLTYEGDNIAQAYRKRFGIDWVTVFKELPMLGIEIDPSYQAQVLTSMQAQIEARKRKRLEKTIELEDTLTEDQDEHFACIIGYTNWGFPYGVTWGKLDISETEEYV